MSNKPPRSLLSKPKPKNLLSLNQRQKPYSYILGFSWEFQDQKPNQTSLKDHVHLYIYKKTM